MNMQKYIWDINTFSKVLDCIDVIWFEVRMF